MAGRFQRLRTTRAACLEISLWAGTYWKLKFRGRKTEDRSQKPEARREPEVRDSVSWFPFWLLAPGFLLHSVSRCVRINLQCPRIDPAGHALRVGESVPAKISARIETSHAVMAHRHDLSVFRPRLHN